MYNSCDSKDLSKSLRITFTGINFANYKPYINAQKNVGPILVNNSPVTDFISYAAGGVANVGYIDISNGFDLNVPTSLRVRLLDCGGSAQATDVYIIIH